MTGAYYASGKLERLVPVRLKTGTDITNGIKQVCEELQIKQGAVLVGIGSVRQLSYCVLTPRSDIKVGAGYTDPEVVPGPVEIVGLSGVIFQSGDGETLLHLHGTFSDKTGKVYAGHVVAGANPILATLDALIGEVTDAAMIRRMDEEVGLALYTPEPA
ncbi:MAG: PPC domain-containing DNA-binding protein [Candidatus Methylomirabilota bacterium]